MTQIVKPNLIRNFGFLSRTWKHGYPGGFSVTLVRRVNIAASESKEVKWLLPWALFLVSLNLKCIVCTEIYTETEV